jgi:hypothetical protein
VQVLVHDNLLDAHPVRADQPHDRIVGPRLTRTLRPEVAGSEDWPEFAGERQSAWVDLAPLMLVEAAGVRASGRVVADDGSVWLEPSPRPSGAGVRVVGRPWARFETVGSWAVRWKGGLAWQVGGAAENCS